MRRTLLLMLALLLLTAVPSGACFGPKLYLGVENGAEGDVLFELLSLYVKEKTGIEMVRVDLAGRDPFGLLGEEKVDLALVADAQGEPALLAVAGVPRIVSGRRPLEDLQFTTVAPALKKLQGLLRAADVTSIVAEVHAGQAPGAAVRHFLMARGWI